jgi:hypothetical protein
MSLDSIKNHNRQSVKLPNGKVIGRFEENKFIKEVYGSKHKLRYPSAWAIDAEAFDKEVKFNATDIVVIDRETDTKYHVSVETFDRLKGELDRGWGRQYFLTLGNWQVQDNGNRQLNLFDWSES